MRIVRAAMLVMLSGVLFLVPSAAQTGLVVGQVQNEEESSNEQDSNQGDNNSSNGARVINGNTAGVSIDAREIVRTLTSTASSSDLTALRRSSAKFKRVVPRVPADRLRCVSLPRLERAVRARMEAGRKPSDEMLHLAGLFRADFLFVYPETGDVVIAGPAAPWKRTQEGHVLATTTRQPVLRLEDVVVCCRAFPPGGPTTGQIGCSIDPTRQGLARMQAYVKSVSVQRPMASAITAGLKESLGQQRVSVLGIPATTHVAKVMVAADYRMKLIGIGLHKPPVAIRSYLSLARPRSSARTLVRWYLVPAYEHSRLRSDHLVLQLGATGARLVGQSELVSSNGERSSSSRRDAASREFTRDFTRQYAALARTEPIYAELRNVMDLSMIAATLQVLDLYGICDWRPDVFLDRVALDVETHDVPNHLPTAVNAVWKGRRLLTPVGGGVTIATDALRESLSRPDDHLARKRPDVPADLADHQWWWDTE